jgi:hypothetical protein
MCEMMFGCFRHDRMDTCGSNSSGRQGGKPFHLNSFDMFDARMTTPAACTETDLPQRVPLFLHVHVHHADHLHDDLPQYACTGVVREV